MRGWVGWGRTHDGLVHFSGGRRIPLALPEGLIPSSTSRCLPLGEDVLVTLPRREGGSELARFNLGSGELRWRLALGGTGMIEDSVVWPVGLPRPGAEPSAQRSEPRAVPMTALNARGERERVVVDLETARVLQRAPRPRGMDSTIVSDGNLWQIATVSGNLELTRLDPATAEPRAGAQRWPRVLLGACSPDDVRYGRLWFAQRFASRGELPWAVLDLASGNVVGSHGDLRPE
jgi:hypothetical protein